MRRPELSPSVGAAVPNMIAESGEAVGTSSFRAQAPLYIVGGVLLVLLVLMFWGPCHESSSDGVPVAPEVASVDSVTPDPPVLSDGMRAAAEESVRKLLRDPESAVFSDETTRIAGIVCGIVNAKNGFGGYVGPQRFIAAGELASIDNDRSQAKTFDTVWTKYCE